MKLWRHECCRVFADKLTTLEDKAAFQKELDHLTAVVARVVIDSPEASCVVVGSYTLFFFNLPVSLDSIALLEAMVVFSCAIDFAVVLCTLCSRGAK